MMEGTSYMFLTGPKVVKTVTGEDVSQENLGGASVHSTKSGVTHFTAKTEEEGFELIRKLLSYIPQNNLEEAPYVDCTDPIDRLEDSLNDIIPDSPTKPYDMYEVIGAIVDNGEFLEIQKDYAKNIIIGFARFNGQSVGIVANQPKYLAGVLDSNASRKGARFVRFCDAFNIPIVSLVDVPGFLPGTGQEYNGVILHGAKLLSGIFLIFGFACVQYFYCSCSTHYCDFSSRPCVVHVTAKLLTAHYDVRTTVGFTQCDSNLRHSSFTVSIQ